MATPLPRSPLEPDDGPEPVRPPAHDRAGDGEFAGRGLTGMVDELWFRLQEGRDRLAARPVPTVATGLVLAAALVGGWWLGQPPPRPDPIELIPMAADGSPTPTATTAAPGAAPGTGAADGAEGPEPSGSTDGSGLDHQGVGPATTVVWLVHVAGAVARPGVVAVAPGDRLADAVAAAGGPTAEAEVHRLNLAAPVVDGMQIRVPTAEDEVVHPEGVVAAPPPVVDPVDPDGGTAPAGHGGLVDLNRATSEELQSLHGIGPALATAIIEHRERIGGFAVVDELLDVPGIGPVTLDRLVDQVTV